MAAGVLTPASPYPAPSRPLLGILTPVRVAFLQLGPELCSDSQLRNVDFSASLHSGDEFKLSRPSLMESRDSELVQGRASKASGAASCATTGLVAVPGPAPGDKRDSTQRPADTRSQTAPP